MESIPFELVEDILCRLPVKPLKRFQCVAKSWYSFIGSERFIKSHLNMSLETNSRRHLILQSGKDIYNVDLDGEDPVKGKASVIKSPFSNSVTHISNSSNGLFLVVAEPLIIWNPFTTEFKYLPGIGDADLPVPLGCFSNTAYGFAYDSRNDDYKVVRAVTHREIARLVYVASQAHIYSMKLNSWKVVAENFTYPVKFWHTNVNGAFHTLLTEYRSPEDTGHCKTMAFSIESEKHYEVKLPLGISDRRDTVKALHKIRGCLSLIYYASESGTEIWVMKEYGVRKSWTKIWSMPILTLTLAELDNGAMKPLAQTKDGRKVMFYAGFDDLLFWRDFKIDLDERVRVKGLPSTLKYVEDCVESLVSINGEKHVHRQIQLHSDQDKKQSKKIKKKRDDFLSTGFKLVL